MGLRYRIDVRELAGRPDVVFGPVMIAVFWDGDFWHGRDWPRLREQLASRANAGYWNTGKRLAGKQIRPTWFGELPVREIRLRIADAGDLLQELENRGVTRGTMMPSLDRVVESLELRRDILSRTT